MIEEQKERTYYRDKCAVFLKTTEEFGGLSNMAGGYPLSVNGIHILTAEALYQACRFPHKPELQKIIIGQKSPMTAKMKTKPYRSDSREDWDDVRVQIMDWCLRVKLAQQWEKFGNLLLSTGNKPIVEESYRDQFWGAKPINVDTLVGKNILGQLLTVLREQLKTSTPDELLLVRPPELKQFLLVNQPIKTIKGTTNCSQSSITPLLQKTIYEAEASIEVKQEQNSMNDEYQNDGNQDTSANYNIRQEQMIIQLSLF